MGRGLFKRRGSAVNQNAEVLKLFVIMHFLLFFMSLFHSSQLILASGVYPHGIVIFLGIKLSLFCFLFKNQHRP